MRTIPITDYGFLITTKIAPYLMLSADRKAGTVPDRIRLATDTGVFDQMAAGCRLVSNYHNPMEAKDRLEDAYGTCRLVYVSDFEGDIATLREDASEIECVRPGDINETCECETVVYLPMLNAPNLFRPAYTGKSQMVEEIRGELAKLGVELPASFSDDEIARHIVEITGTTYV